jgi:hypothetical protein
LSTLCLFHATEPCVFPTPKIKKSMHKFCIVFLGWCCGEIVRRRDEKHEISLLWPNTLLLVWSCYKKWWTRLAPCSSGCTAALVSCLPWVHPRSQNWPQSVTSVTW